MCTYIKKNFPDIPIYSAGDCQSSYMESKNGSEQVCAHQKSYRK